MVALSDLQLSSEPILDRDVNGSHMCKQLACHLLEGCTSSGTEPSPGPELASRQVLD